MPPKKKPAALTAKQEEEELAEMVRNSRHRNLPYFLPKLIFAICTKTLSPPGDKALLTALVDQGADHDPPDQAWQGRLRWGGVRR